MFTSMHDFPNWLIWQAQHAVFSSYSFNPGWYLALSEYFLIKERLMEYKAMRLVCIFHLLLMIYQHDKSEVYFRKIWLCILRQFIYFLHRGQSPADAEVNYLHVVSSLDMYGVELHKASVKVSRYLIIKYWLNSLIYLIRYQLQLIM
jgi:hypothetical protein